MNPYRPNTEDSMDTNSSSSTNNQAPSFEDMNGNKTNDAWSLLVMARQLIAQGKPSIALQMILEAKRAQGGDYAAMQTLQRARSLYRNKIQENAAADDLASLFAECAISESQDPQTNFNFSQPPAAGTRVPPAPLDVANDTSILAMSGRMQIMLDAFSDGSSFICLKCGGLVSSVRRDEHLAYWCS